MIDSATIAATEDRWPLVHLLLCAADIARQGYVIPLSVAAARIGSIDDVTEAAFAARDVHPHAFDFSGDLLAATLLEAAYRAADGSL